ncbi:metal-dependent hydrolase family protein [Streptomyces sp. NBC_00162]|uniref:metal-dependent hydrolase family protein n=1 Tax=Streptomyces sp. NBC_00162 TaxID=2903629 RepID=UPI00214B9B4F|nr:amidohydrolase family protein [Streptomyces sp. NBC_00162]UUU44474.1 amidohydrolase family protein [Streptomyces sp. NBC_00162]
MQAVLSAGRMVTGSGGRETADGAVFVDRGVIAAAGPRAAVEAQAGPAVPRLAFPEGTLLPGLIDTHVHLALDAGPDPVKTLQAATDTELYPGMAERARRLLATGVTTVRDLGDRGGLAVRLRDEIAGRRLPGPRILAAGTPLTGPGGHCWFLGGEVEGAEAIRAAVRRNAESGVDLIKVMATGGGITKGGPPVWQAQFTTQELRIVVEEAKRFGLPVAAHAHGTEGIAAAVAAGVDTIEHCTWMGRDGFDVREDLVAAIAAQGIAVGPAASPDWRGFAERFGRERAEEMFERIRWMAQRGVRLLPGTDAGVSRAVFDDFVSSLEFFEHIGLTPAEIIDLATTGAAQALGISHDTGRLAAGYRADVLVVDGDPLSDLRALRSVRLVLAGGHPLDPELRRP